MNLLRKILFPIVPIYYVVTWLRNLMYDFGIKKSKDYDFPVIAVGNLSVGGTGKSPMVEYLIRLLKNEINVGTLSRGYKRETKGFQLVQSSSTAREVGDEPLQFKTKFKNVAVGVDGNRQRGITNLRASTPKPETIILDDAYQHRKVKAGFYILLTAYYNLYTSDILLPTGDLREPRKGARRADIIIVTKCPIGISDKEKQDIARKLNINDKQSLFFSSISYGKDLVCSSGIRSIDLFKENHFTLVTGIATPKPLLEYYNSLGLKFDHVNFPDHHNFSDNELIALEKKSCIVTTEKDYTRLASELSMKNIWYQPIEMRFLTDQEAFDSLILKYVKVNK